jgi:hypothetical protein
MPRAIEVSPACDSAGCLSLAVALIRQVVADPATCCSWTLMMRDVSGVKAVTVYAAPPARVRPKF